MASVSQKSRHCLRIFFNNLLGGRQSVKFVRWTGFCHVEVMLLSSYRNVNFVSHPIVVQLCMPLP